LVDEKVVYFGGCDEQLHGVEVANGKGLFTHALDAPVPGTASKWKDTLYVGTHGGRFLAFDLKEKKVSWEITEAEDGFYATAAVNEEYLVLAGRDKLLRNLDPKTGKERWVVNMRSSMDSSPIIVGDKVIVGTKGGKCVSLNLKSGEKIWEYDVGAQIVGALSYANDVLYVSVKNGNLYAFGRAP
jgi:outer membrane protein assembly factor BamB